MTLTPEIRSVVTAGRLGHLTTLHADGSPQVSAVWIGIEGNDIVIGHLMGAAKTRNIAPELLQLLAAVYLDADVKSPRWPTRRRVR